MAVSRTIEGERIDFCRLPMGGEKSFAYTPVHRPGENEKRRVDNIKLLLIRERADELRREQERAGDFVTVLTEQQIQRWSHAYDAFQNIIVIGGSGDEQKAKEKTGEEKPAPLIVWGYEMLRRVDTASEVNATTVTTLPVRDAEEKAAIVELLAKTWSNATFVPQEGNERSQPGIAENKQPVVFR
jgi:hypothetical protein